MLKVRRTPKVGGEFHPLGSQGPRGGQGSPPRQPREAGPVRPHLFPVPLLEQSLESLLISLRGAQLECRAAETDALLALLREPLHAAREAARFDARAG